MVQSICLHVSAVIASLGTRARAPERSRSSSRWPPDNGRCADRQFDVLGGRDARLTHAATKHMLATTQPDKKPKSSCTDLFSRPRSTGIKESRFDNKSINARTALVKPRRHRHDDFAPPGRQWPQTD
jgi:hypothetical protein